MSITQINVPRPDPTTSSSGSYLEPNTPWYRVHKWGGISPVPRWYPDVSECTPVWGPLLLVTPPPRDITTTRPPHVLPSSSWYICPPYGETPPGPSTFSLSPPKFRCCTAVLTVPLPYTSSHGPVPLLLSSPTTSKSPPTVSVLYFKVWNTAGQLLSESREHNVHFKKTIHSKQINYALV